VNINIEEPDYSSSKTTEIYTRVSTVDIEHIKNPIDNIDV
jgi:hypothetical protein